MVRNGLPVGSPEYSKFDLGLEKSNIFRIFFRIVSAFSRKFPFQSWVGAFFYRPQCDGKQLLRFRCGTTRTLQIFFRAETGGWVSTGLPGFHPLCGGPGVGRCRRWPFLHSPVPSSLVVPPAFSPVFCFPSHPQRGWWCALLHRWPSSAPCTNLPVHSTPAQGRGFEGGCGSWTFLPTAECISHKNKGCV